MRSGRNLYKTIEEIRKETNNPRTLLTSRQCNTLWNIWTRSKNKDEFKRTAKSYLGWKDVKEL